MVDDVPPLPVYLVGTNTGADALTTTLPIDGTVVEASAATNASSNANLLVVARSSCPHPTVNTSPANVSVWAKNEPRYGVVAATFDGAGGLAATGLVPALALYFGVIDRIRWFCDSTDAAVNLTFQDGAATAVIAFTPTAGIVATQTLAGGMVDDIDGVPLYTTLDNSVINVLCADNSGPAAGEITFVVEYHYEQ